MDSASGYTFNEVCKIGEASGCIIAVFFNLGKVAYGLLPITVIGADLWSASRKRKHWIPPDSLLLGALALQFLAILQISFDFSGDNRIDLSKCDVLHTFGKEEIHVLSGRVSVCVLMGCLLPGVVRPLSASLWSDMAALVITSSLFLFQIFEDAQTLYWAFESSNHCEIGMPQFYLMQLANGIIIMSIIFMVLILGSAALASVAIPQIISHKIPTIFPPPNFHTQFRWEKVEEEVTKSWIVVRTSDPQYVISRSSLTSSVALLVTACNGVLICQMFVFRKHSRWTLFTATEGGLRCVVIVMGSFVIYWRCIAQVLYSPKGLEWTASGLLQYFQIEDFWKSHLLRVMGRSRNQGKHGRSCLVKMISKLCRAMRLHKLLHVLYWLLMFSVLFSKLCCLLSHLLLSNKYFGKLVMGAAYDELSNLYRSAGVLEQSYLRALVNMQGENCSGLWVANRKSIGEIKKRIEEGEEEGKQCDALISLLIDKTSPDFCGAKSAKPQNNVVKRLQVERELDVSNCSWKTTLVSIIVVIIELSTFSHDEGEAKIVLKRCIDGCSQAWNIMEVVENNGSERVEDSITGDEMFRNVVKRQRWLEYNLPLSRPVDKSLISAKAAIQNLIEKGKEIANRNCSSKASEAIAGYSLYRIGRVCMDEEHHFNSVEDICDRMCGMLADVMGSCCVKAAGVVMEDCKKWASKSDEESIINIGRVVGKVKGVIESVGWSLNWRSDEETSSTVTTLAKDETPALRRFLTFQIG